MAVTNLTAEWTFWKGNRQRRHSGWAYSTMTRKTKRCPLPARRSSKLITDDQDRCHLSPCRTASAIDRVGLKIGWVSNIHSLPFNAESSSPLGHFSEAPRSESLTFCLILHQCTHPSIHSHPFISDRLMETVLNYIWAPARHPHYPRLCPSSSFSWCGGPRQCHAYKLFDLSNFSENFFTSEAHDVIGWLKWLTKRQLLKFYYLISIAVIKVQRRSMH